MHRPACTHRVLLATFTFLIFISSANAATENLLHQFVNIKQGAYPQSGLVADAQGNLYGTTVYGGVFGFGTVFQLTRDSNGAWKQTILHSFTGFDDGAYPNGNVVLDSGGNVYGATNNGGNLNCITGCGVVFELSPGSNSSWTEKVLHQFGSTYDGTFPNGSLVFDSAGSLYGTTSSGGLQIKACRGECGTVFQLTPSGGKWKESLLYEFKAGSDGSSPLAGVVFDSHGNLYGTTSSVLVFPAAFELSPSSNGWTLTTLHTFNSEGDASRPNGLIVDSAGNLYGTSYEGGAAGHGTVFELTNSNGSWTESVLYSFQSGQDGANPQAGLILDGSGNLYGTTENGGTNNFGSVFKLAPSQGTWTETVLYRFQGGQDGAYPFSSLVLTPSGNLFGTTQQGSLANFGTVFDLTPSAGSYTESLIYSFPATDGDFLRAGLVADPAGNLYGTTTQGGLNQCPDGGFVYSGCGTVFKLSLSPKGIWQRTIIYEFTQAAGGDDVGCPEATLIFDAAGNLYGTTSGCLTNGVGEVFELLPAAEGEWTFKVLYRFLSNPDDGFHPFGKLAFDVTGNLYGTTSEGGSGQKCYEACGTVFKLAPAGNGQWSESVIYNFQGRTDDGCDPLAGLVIDSAGNLYGTASGNSGTCPGVVFELSPNSNGGWTEKALYSFAGGPDGGVPEGGLIFDSLGNLYGTASTGGYTGGFCPGGCGVIFELSPSPNGVWTETVLYSFTGIPDGDEPSSDLTFDASGNLYGTTYYGGVQGSACTIYGCGTVFKLTNFDGAWTESVLHIFGGAVADGSQPLSNVILDSAGNVYGTTSVGGVNGNQAFNGGIAFQIIQ